MSLTALLTSTVLPALLPVVTDGVRAGINKLAGGDQQKPANFKEHLELAKLDIERLKALADLDKHNNAAMPWQVDAIKTLQRPFFGVTLLLTYVGCIVASAPDSVTFDVGNYVSMFGFYLFGERFYRHRAKDAREGR